MTTFYTYFSTLLLLCSFLAGGYSQDLQVQHPPTFLNTMEDVAMHTSGSGLAIGSSGILLKTTDFGENWTVEAENLFSTRRVAAIPGVNDQAFILFASSQIRMTADAGKSWQIGTLPMDYDGGSLKFYALPSTDVFYAANSDNILKSVDAGLNWTDITPDIMDLEITSISFADDNAGWFGTESGEIYQTTDGGANWTALLTGFTDDVLVEFMDTNIGYATVWKDLYKTTDGGQTWTLRLANAFGSHLDQIVIIDEDRLAFSQGALVVYATGDGGQTVKRFTALPYGYNYQYMTALPDGRVWLACSYGSIALSENGGLDYTDQIPAIKHTLNHIDFTDQNNGWAAGRGGLVRTQNGGDQWEPVNLPPNPVEPEDITSVQLLKAQNYSNTIIGTEYGVYETTDGGTSWQNLLSTVGGERFRSFTSNGDHIWALSSEPMMHHSSDNGMSWTSTSTPNLTFIPRFMTFPTTSLGFLGGTSGRLWRTTDGGMNWTEVSSFTEESLRSAFFLNEMEGWIIPEGYSDFVFHTNDGGLTWEEMTHYGNSFWNRFYAASSQELYIFGGTATSGTAAYSSDGGATWQLLFNSFVVAYQDIVRVDVANGFYFWVCGAAGWIARANFLETSTANIPIEELSVFPNPSTGQVWLQFPTDWQSEGAATYELYDAVGQLQQSGQADSHLDFQTLPTGNYLLIVRQKEKHYRARLIIQ